MAVTSSHAYNVRLLSIVPCFVLDIQCEEIEHTEGILTKRYLTGKLKNGLLLTEIVSDTL